MKLPTLYGRTKTGAVQEWTIETQGDNYRTIYGQVGGKIQTSEWTRSYPTNVDRSNYRDGVEQAIFEAKAIHKKKVDSGYYEDVKDIDKAAFIEPMLAKKYEDCKDKLKFPVYSQPKLDGSRCVATKDGMFSRNGKVIVSCPHISAALKDFFTEFPEAVLDGELYNHNLKADFNKMMSLVKKSKPTPADLAESAQMVEYWVYDCITDGNFNIRTEFIADHLQNIKSVVIVPTKLVGESQMLDALYEDYLEEGYEGQMVRTNSEYENCRTKALLKRKEFTDAEFEIVDITEGDGSLTGNVGRVILKTSDGEQFMAAMTGTREYTKEIWDHKNEYIGKQATVKYFNLTPPPRCVPRFGKVTAIRDYE